MNEKNILRANFDLGFTYTRSTGPIVGHFLTCLQSCQIMGIKNSKGKVLMPPVEFDPDTGEVPIDSKGRLSYSTGMSYCPSIKKHVVMGYLPTNIAIPGKPMSLEYFNENGNGVYPMTVQIVGKGSLYDPENERVRS